MASDGEQTGPRLVEDWWDETVTAPVPDGRLLDDSLTLVGRSPSRASELADAPLSGEGAREVLAQVLGVEPETLAAMPPAAALEALGRLRQMLARLTTSATIDELTGAWRRGPGLQAIRREMDRASRGDHRLVLTMIDVDGLKTVNDTHGHLAGDALLRQVATTLREQLRSYDIVCRYGGDEFVCAFPGAELGDAELRMREVAFALAAASGGNTVSQGLAQLRPGETLQELVGRADAALYAGRRRRRRRGA